jgi:hypothetical protein
VAALADERDSKGVETLGRITAIQPDSKHLTVMTTGGERQKLQVDERTRMELDGRPTALGSFVVGDPVKVRYASGAEPHRVITLKSDTATARQVREKMRDGMKTAGKYAFEEKEKFQKRMNHLLEDLDAQIARLQAKEKEVDKATRKRYAREITALKKQAREARRELRQAETATAERWENVRKGAANALERLRDAIDQAAERLRKRD